MPAAAAPLKAPQRALHTRNRLKGLVPRGWIEQATCRLQVRFRYQGCV